MIYQKFFCPAQYEQVPGQIEPFQEEIPARRNMRANCYSFSPGK